MAFCWLGLSLAVFPGTMSAQDRNGGVVTGLVRNAQTGDPVENVNIFLANTTIGISSDKNGLFTISHIPVGSYELIFSSVSYDRISKVVQIFRNDSIHLNIALQPHDVQLGEVEVSATRDDDWNHALKIFKD